jgi:hydrogenase maturation protease
VVGCGNPTAGDDVAGVEVARRLSQQVYRGCQFAIVPHAGPGVLDLFASVDAVLFVDAVVTDSPPGTIHLVPFPSREIEPRRIGSLSSHGWGLAETLDLARALNRPVPRLMLLGVEAETASEGAIPTQAVEEAVALICRNFDALYGLLTRPDSKVWLGPRHFAPGDCSFPGE